MNCPYCKNNQILTNRYDDADLFFCKDCEVFYQINKENGLPIYVKEGAIRSHICKRCALLKQITVCKSFDEYYKNIPLCQSCKILNRARLKDLYYRHHLLFRKSYLEFKRILISLSILLLAYFLDWPYGKLLGIFAIEFLQISLWRACVKIAAALYNIDFAVVIGLLIDFKRMVRRVEYYEMPILIGDNIEHLIGIFDRLTVRDEKKIIRESAQQKSPKKKILIKK